MRLPYTRKIDAVKATSKILVAFIRMCRKLKWKVLLSAVLKINVQSSFVTEDRQVDI